MKSLHEHLVESLEAEETQVYKNAEETNEHVEEDNPNKSEDNNDKPEETE